MLSKRQLTDLSKIVKTSSLAVLEYFCKHLTWNVYNNNTHIFGLKAWNKVMPSKSKYIQLACYEIGYQK